MTSWKDRISDEVKELVDLDLFRKMFADNLKKKLKDMQPINYSERQTSKEMVILLTKKGVSNSDAIHLLHVSEVTRYSGCGCCLHRKNIEN